MDHLLRQLHTQPVPPTLAQIDTMVISALRERRADAQSMQRVLSIAAVFALGLGYVGGTMMPAPALASERHLFLSETALAPSTLLNFL